MDRAVAAAAPHDRLDDDELSSNGSSAFIVVDLWG